MDLLLRVLSEHKTGPTIQRTLGTGLCGKGYTIQPWWECFVLQCKPCHTMQYDSRLNTNSTFATSAYTPGVFDTAKHFNVSTDAAILPLTLYVLGMFSALPSPSVVG
jgi:hypothetical protein